MDASRIKALRIQTDANIVRIAVAGRASFFQCLSAEPEDSDDPNSRRVYRTAILVPKAAPKEVMNVLLQGLKDAIEIGKKKKWGGIVPSDLQKPFGNGDEKAAENDKYEAYRGCWHMSAKKLEKHGPPIIMANKQPVTTPGIIESGDWCIFDITLYPFANKRKGVAVGLNGVTLIEQGERLSGGPSEEMVSNAAQELYGDELAGPVSSGTIDDLLGGMGDADDGLAGLLN